MMMLMVTMMVNICDDDCDLVMKALLVKEVMSSDVSPVAMFIFKICLSIFKCSCEKQMKMSSLATGLCNFVL